MAVPGAPQMFKVLKRVFDETFIKTAEIGGGKSKRIFPGEMMEIPIDELPVESVVVRDKQHPSVTIGL